MSTLQFDKAARLDAAGPPLALQGWHNEKRGVGFGVGALRALEATF
jgi:hypothetical protein